MFQSCPLVCSQLNTHPDNIVWSRPPTHPTSKGKRWAIERYDILLFACFALYTIHVCTYIRDLWELHVAHEGERTHGDQFDWSISCFYLRVETMHCLWQSVFCLSCIEYRIVIFKSATLLMNEREVVGERNPRGSSCWKHFLLLSLPGQYEWLLLLCNR